MPDADIARIRNWPTAFMVSLYEMVDHVIVAVTPVRTVDGYHLHPSITIPIQYFAHNLAVIRNKREDRVDLYLPTVIWT